MNSKSGGRQVAPEREDEDRAFVQSELAFFGRIAANVSHEFKNRLATINEKTGLLEDLASMADSGIRPLDLSRVKSLAREVARQVQIADAACLKLNRFAHSVDLPKKRENIVELLSLIASLIERQSIVRGVDIRIEPCPEIQGEINPFLFEQVIYYCLMWAIDSSPSSSITICARQSGDTIRIMLRGAAFVDLLRDPPRHLARALIELGGRLEPGNEKEEMALLI